MQKAYKLVLKSIGYMKKNNILAKKLAIISGLLLLLSGGSGVATVQMLAGLLFEFVPQYKLLTFLYTVLLIFASFGGITVMIGGFLIGKQKVTIGRLLIQLGSGMGVIGLIFTITIAIINNSLIIGSFFSLGTLGVVLGVIAILISTKPKSKKPKLKKLFKKK